MSTENAIAELSTLLGDRLKTSKAERAAHGQSETHFPPMLPDAVAWPKDTAEVSAIVKICAAHGCPVIPFGTGTSLEGHTLAPQGGITLDIAQSRTARHGALLPHRSRRQCKPRRHGGHPRQRHHRRALRHHGCWPTAG